MSEMALQLIRQAKAEGWKRLDLGNTWIVGEVPPEIWELEELEELILSDRWREYDGGRHVDKKSIHQGTVNQISSFPGYPHQPITIPAAQTNTTRLGGLSRLKKLVLTHARIADISSIAHLAQLTHLYLCFTNVANIQPLASLTQLAHLDLAETQVSDIRPLAELVHLEILKLNLTWIENIQSLAKLKKLTYLNLHNTAVKDVQPLAHLSRLKRLDLDCTDIEDIGPLSQLSGLQKLRIDSTLVTDIEPLSNLLDLKKLRIHSTLVTDIEPIKHLIKGGLAIKQSDDLTEGIFIHNCPLTNPPYEIAIQGNEAILAYWRDRDEEKAIPATELKLFLVGNPTAGKSTLAHILAHQVFPDATLSTIGASIDQTWKVNGKTVHIWDFGGQEYFHATHELLVNDNALYIVVVDPKLDGDGFFLTEVKHPNEEAKWEQLEHFHHRYWLELVHAKAPNGQVMLLWNKLLKKHHYRDARIEDADHALFHRGTPLTDFKNDLLLAFKENDPYWHRKWMDFEQSLTEAIDEHLANREVLTFWPVIRDRLAALAQTRLYITRAEFDRICLEGNPNRDIRNIITYLKDMVGRILYWDCPGLADIVFIHPHHINTLIHAVLNCKVNPQHGRFGFAEAHVQVEQTMKEIKRTERIEAVSFEAFTADLLLIMQEFELIFEVSPGSQHYVAPQYLPAEQPSTVKAAADFARLAPGFALRFAHYIPRHIVPRFIAAKGLLAVEDYYWKHGIIFREEGAHAFVWVDYPARTITVQCGQPDMSALDDRPLGAIFATLHRLLPANADMEVSLDKNEWVSYKDIQTAILTDAQRVVSTSGALLPLSDFRWIALGGPDDEMG